jgi:hypothetical protein
MENRMGCWTMGDGRWSTSMIGVASSLLVSSPDPTAVAHLSFSPPHDSLASYYRWKMADGDDARFFQFVLPLAHCLWTEINIVWWQGRRFATYRLAASLEGEWGFGGGRGLSRGRNCTIVESRGWYHFKFMMMLGDFIVFPSLLSCQWNRFWVCIYAIDLYRIIC